MRRWIPIALALVLAAAIAWLARFDALAIDPARTDVAVDVPEAASEAIEHATAERAPERLVAQSVRSRIASADRAAAPDPAAELAGVVALAGGAPAVGADVVLTTVPARGWTRPAARLGLLERRVHARTRTDERGRFAFFVAPGRAFDVEARLAGAGIARASEVSGPKSITMELEPFATLDVRVTSEDGAPVRDARVLVCERGTGDVERADRSDRGDDFGLSRSSKVRAPILEALTPVAETRTDAEGRCVLDALAAGAWTVAATPDATLPASESIVLHAGERREVVLVARAGRALRAYVEAAETHAPIAGAEVRTLDFPWKLARTDERGYATIVGALGATVLVARAEGRAEARLERRVNGVADTLYTFSLRAEQRVRGRVVDAERRAMPAVLVLAIDESYPHELVRGTETLADGSFELDGLDPTEPSVVVVRAEGFATLVVRANDPPSAMGSAAGDEEPRLAGPALVDLGEIVLVAPGVASGRVTYADGSPAPGVALTLRRSGGWIRRSRASLARGTSSLGDGTFLFDDLAAGEYQLHAGARGPDDRGARAVPLTLAPGESRTDLVLVVPRSFTLRGTVLDPWGNGVAGAVVHTLSRGGPAVCDASGRFEIELDSAAPRAIEARCTQSPYSGGPESVDLFPARMEDVTPAMSGLVLQLPRGVPIRGTVRRARTPAASHGVQAIDEHGTTVATAFTDADGGFELSVPEHAIVALAVHPPLDPSGKGGLRIRGGEEPLVRVPRVQAGRERVAIELPPR